MSVLNQIEEYVNALIVTTDKVMPKYCVVLVKATRAPVVLESDLGFEKAVNSLKDWAHKISVLNKNKLAPNGISIQIYLADDEAKIRSIEIGSPTFKEIKCFFEYGAW